MLCNSYAITYRLLWYDMLLRLYDDIFSDIKIREKLRESFCKKKWSLPLHFLAVSPCIDDRKLKLSFPFCTFSYVIYTKIMRFDYIWGYIWGTLHIPYWKEEYAMPKKYKKCIPISINTSFLRKKAHSTTLKSFSTVSLFVVNVK